MIDLATPARMPKRAFFNKTRKKLRQAAFDKIESAAAEGDMLVHKMAKNEKEWELAIDMALEKMEMENEGLLHESTKALRTAQEEVDQCVARIHGFRGQIVDICEDEALIGTDKQKAEWIKFSEKELKAGKHRATDEDGDGILSAEEHLRGYRGYDQPLKGTDAMWDAVQAEKTANAEAEEARTDKENEEKERKVMQEIVDAAGLAMQGDLVGNEKDATNLDEDKIVTLLRMMPQYGSFSPKYYKNSSVPPWYCRAAREAKVSKVKGQSKAWRSKIKWFNPEVSRVGRSKEFSDGAIAINPSSTPAFEKVSKNPAVVGNLCEADAYEHFACEIGGGLTEKGRLGSGGNPVYPSPHKTAGAGVTGSGTWDNLNRIGTQNPWPEWLRGTKKVKSSDLDMAKKQNPSYWALGPNSWVATADGLDPGGEMDNAPEREAVKNANLLQAYFESCIIQATCLEEIIATHAAIREGKGAGRFSSQEGEAMRAIPPGTVDTYWKEVGWKEEAKVKKLTLEEAMAREAMLAEASVPEPEPEAELKTE